jgi:hypothetical protein
LRTTLAPKAELLNRTSKSAFDAAADIVVRRQVLELVSGRDTMRTLNADLSGTNCTPSAIETYGAVLPNLLIEAVVDLDHRDQLRLETWNGHRSKTAPRACYQGRTYVAGPINAGLMQVVRFPPSSQMFGSVASLVSSVREVFFRYTNASAEVTSILAAFTLASFFTDCVPVAPILDLVGPESEVSLVLRLLGCTCRRPLMLGDVDMAALATLPAQLGATLLVNQRGLNRSITRVLQASRDRHFRVARGKRALDLYGPKAFSSDAGSMAGPGVEACISPSPLPRPLLTEAAEEEIATHLQAKLLRYRMVYHCRVRNATVDCGKFSPMTCEEAHAWLAPLCDCPDLQGTVSNYLLEMSQEVAGHRFTDLRCVVAEGALSFCHEPDRQEFFIRDLSERVSALLKGRHEEAELSDRKVGSVLRDLGIRAQRMTAGYKVLLSDAIRERVHSIASSYRVLSLQDGVVRCRHCPGGSEKEPVN